MIHDHLDNRNHDHNHDHFDNRNHDHRNDDNRNDGNDGITITIILKQLTACGLYNVISNMAS